MLSKGKGLHKKYDVKKVDEPFKKIDALVLEFEDNRTHLAIFRYAKDMKLEGNTELHDALIKKLNENSGNQGVFF